jgi:hypothetical protein
MPGLLQKAAIYRPRRVDNPPWQTVVTSTLLQRRNGCISRSGTEQEGTGKRLMWVISGGTCPCSTAPVELSITTEPDTSAMKKAEKFDEIPEGKSYLAYDKNLQPIMSRYGQPFRSAISLLSTLYL